MVLIYLSPFCVNQRTKNLYQKILECSKSFWKVHKCSRIFRNLLECSERSQKVRECFRKFQKVPTHEVLASSLPNMKQTNVFPDLPIKKVDFNLVYQRLATINRATKCLSLEPRIMFLFPRTPMHYFVGIFMAEFLVPCVETDASLRLKGDHAAGVSFVITSCRQLACGSRQNHSLGQNERIYWK